MGIKWKYLLLTAPLVLVMAGAFQHVVQGLNNSATGASEDSVADLPRKEAKFKKTLPRKQGPFTIVDAKFEPKRLAYWLTVDTESYNFDPALTEQRMKQQACTDPYISTGIRDGIAYEYNYDDEHKHSLTAIRITKCP
jgi:hypothetical protein